MEKEDIEFFLYWLGMDDELEVFKSEDIDLDLFKELSDVDLKMILKDLNLKIGK